ncbi:MAG: insulinase family protein [Proteobacteria bacterium]|nr:insulinase family protein [Pseudomonadota bacterium]
MIRSAAVLSASALFLSSCCSVFQGSPPETSGTAEPPPVEEPAASDHPAMPVPGDIPAWEVPAATTFTLSNGIPVTFVQAGKVPLAKLRVNIHTGSSADPAGKAGLADFTADMLNEGAGPYDALQLSDELLRLASSVGFGAALEYSYVQVDSLEDKLDATLALTAQMMGAPTFDADDVERVRGDRLNRILTSRDQLQTVGYEAFAKIIFGDAYIGRPTEGNAATVGAITREDLVAWHASVWNADNASIVAAGRSSVEDMTALLEKHFGLWPTGDAAARPTAPAVEAAPQQGVTIYWIDRPGASQSYLSVGNLAPAWDADRQTLRSVSNNVLGGYFTSRLNMNLREDKGYTYGARTRLSGDAQGGMFRAVSSVKAATTALSLQEFMKEISEIVAERPITAEEFEAATSRLVQGQPANFENLGGVLGQYGHSDAVGRPAGWLSGLRERVGAVTIEAAQAELASIVDPAHLAIVIVGDWNHEIDMGAETRDGQDRNIVQTVGEQVTALGYGPIVMLDEHGDPISAPADKDE